MSMQLPKNQAFEMRAKIEKDKKDKEQRGGFFNRLFTKDKKQKKAEEERLAKETKNAMKSSGKSDTKQQK